MTLRKHKILESFKAMAQQAQSIMDADVVSVDETEMTCLVELANGQQIEDVQLKALKEASDCVIIFPKVGSTIQMIRLIAGWLVVSCDEVEKVTVKAASLVQIDCEDVAITTTKKVQVHCKEAVLSATDKLQIDCDNVIFNGGSNNGLVKIDELLKNLNSIKTYLKTVLEPAIELAFQAVGSGSSASGSVGATKFVQETQSENIDFSVMENKKITH